MLCMYLVKLRFNLEIAFFNFKLSSPSKDLELRYILSSMGNAGTGLMTYLLKRQTKWPISTFCMLVLITFNILYVVCKF